MHSDLKTRDARQPRRRQAALQRLGELLRAMLVAHRLTEPRALVLDLGGKRFAVAERVEALLGRPLAIARRGAAILGGQFAIFGGLCTALRRAATLPSGTDDRSGTAALARVLLRFHGGLELGHRRSARGGGLVASLRGEIAAVGDRVALIGRAQARPRSLVALAGGLLAVAGRALAHIAAVLVRVRGGAADEVAVTGGLIVIGSQLITVSAGLICVSTRLICIRQRLIAIGERLLEITERLLVSDAPRRHVGRVIVSLNPPIGNVRRRIA